MRGTLYLSITKKFSAVSSLKVLADSSFQISADAYAWITVPLFPSVCAVFSSTQLTTTLWTAALQALLSTKFSRQEYWSGLPFLTPEDLPNPGIEAASLAPPALAGGFFATVPPGAPFLLYSTSNNCQEQIALKFRKSTRRYSDHRG